jgi:hypothetical protein
MFLKNSYVVETLRPHRLPLSVRRVLQRNQSILRCFENSQNVEMKTITGLRCRLGTSSLDLDL